jgi:hypothetical protein
MSHITKREFIDRLRKIVETVPPEKWLAEAGKTWDDTAADKSDCPDEDRGGCLVQRAMDWTTAEFHGSDAEAITGWDANLLAHISDEQNIEAAWQLVNDLEQENAL